MKSESLFTKCANCGKDVSKSLSKCPDCGAKLKKLSIIHWIGIVLGIIILIGLISSSKDTTQTDPRHSETRPSKNMSGLKNIPASQKKFIDLIDTNVQKYRTAKNELQKSAIRTERKQALCEITEGFTVSDWIGTLNALNTNSEGNAVLSIRISPNIEIKTWNNALSDTGSNTLIEKDTSLFNELFYLSRGQKVMFSGSFFTSEKDCLKELSVTEEGAMTKPEFLMKFNKVKALK